MHAVWVDEHNDADYIKLGRYGIDTPYFSIRDPNVANYLEHAHERTGKGGIYFAWNWYPTLTGRTLADVVSLELQHIIEDLRGLGVASSATFPAVCANLEDDATLNGDAYCHYVADFCARWRQHRQQRLTDWALQAHKGELFASLPHVVSAINAAKVGIVPELYAGNPVVPQDGLALATDLITRGFLASYVHGFYWGRWPLPEWWDGYVFTQGQLP